MQRILGTIRKAVEDYNMIKDGDKIAVGLSGGKDSITLLYALNTFKKYLSYNIEIVGLSINPGFDGFYTSNLEKICKEIDIPFIVKESQIKQIVFDERKEKNPCSLCANLRRGMLNSFAKEAGCNKVALGHNQDDVIETFLLNLFYTGSINTFAPVTYLSRSDIHTIRPMIYLPENEIRRFIKRNNITVIKKCCPQDGYTKREYMKDLIIDLSKDIPPLRKSLVGAIKRSNINGWNENHIT